MAIGFLIFPTLFSLIFGFGSSRYEGNAFEQ